MIYTKKSEYIADDLKYWSPNLILIDWGMCFIIDFAHLLLEVHRKYICYFSMPISLTDRW